MLEIIFVCMMGQVKKEIKVETLENRVENKCKVYIDAKEVEK